ncbi:MAG: metalloregulator ArsR/SmtB family transcription factor [Chloroflexota bacterium]
MNADKDLEARAQLFKALGHPVRLLLLNLIRTKPRHGEELAAILHLQPGTISHHLAQLVEAGLLTSQKDQYYQVYSLVAGVLERPLSDLVHLPQPDLHAEVEVDAYRDKVLRTFFKRGRLTRLPAQLKKQQVVLEKIVQTFEPERDYSERDVNFILLDFHEDVAALRRGLIEHGLMTRNQGVYRRVVGDR